MDQLLPRGTSFNVWRMLSILVLSASFNSVVFAQDPLFSQYYAMPLHMNPGFSGISYAPRLAMIYRNQWPQTQSGTSAYVTYGVSYDQFFKKINSGIGFHLLADDAGGGLIKTLKGAFTYGYQTKIDRNNFLRGGIEIGWVQTRYAWDKFVFGDQLDPEFGLVSPGGTPLPTTEIRPDKVQTSYLDIGTGLLYFNPNFNLGISAKHINTPSNDILKVNPSAYSGLPIRWIFHGNFRVDLGGSPRRKSMLSPAFLVAAQSGFFQVNAGAQYQFSTVFAGLWYRHARRNADAVIGVLGVRKGIWKFAYSFDYTLSSLGIDLGGSHELSIGISLDEVIRQKVDISDCFEAFR